MTTAQAQYTDAQRAVAAKAKATRTLPPEIAATVIHRLEDATAFPSLIDRGRWKRLLQEIEGIEEGETP